MTRSVLVTGATGFIGERVCRRLHRDGHQVTAASRRPCRLAVAHTLRHDLLAERVFADGDLPALDAVVHAAGAAHGAAESEAGQAVNATAPVKVAEAAAHAGARHVVFLSTASVYGDTPGPEALSEHSPRAPDGVYGRAKADAEDALHTFCSREGLRLSILRPPMVYGRGAPGNFRLLLRGAQWGLPLPRQTERVYRSVLAIDNLCDLIAHLLDHPERADGVFLPTDRPEITVADFYRATAEAAGARARFVPLPDWVLSAACRLPRIGTKFSRLVTPFRLAGALGLVQAGWQPPFDTRRALREGPESCPGAGNAPAAAR